MQVTFGMKAHSGWAAVVVLGISRDEVVVLDRKRIELVDQLWAKAPYHAAEKMEIKQARSLVKRGVDSAHRIALQQVKALIENERRKVEACAVLVGSPMPDWSTDEILAVHFRMHKAEGALFQEALLRAAEACGLKALRVPEKTLRQQAEEDLGVSASELNQRLAALGKTLGAPWSKDQKSATIAAWMAASR